MTDLPRRTDTVPLILAVLNRLPAELAKAPDIDRLSAGDTVIEVAGGDAPHNRTVTMRFTDPRLADRVRRAATGATGLASALDENGDTSVVTLYKFPATPLAVG